MEIREGHLLAFGVLIHIYIPGATHVDSHNSFQMVALISVLSSI